MKKAYEDCTLTDLFTMISNTAGMYAHEASGLDPFSSGKLDELPLAMLYRARVIEQKVDEIKARAYHLQQAEYDKLAKDEKIKWHEEEVAKIKSLFTYDPEDYEYHNEYLQPHLQQILIIESYNDYFQQLPENQWTFGGEK